VTESYKVFEYVRKDYSITVWRLGEADDEPGNYYVETTGGPALSPEQFAVMAKRVAEDAKQK